MGVGSLHSPREYDGRLPPDVGYYLDLVLPRSEEPRKKTHASYNNTMEDYEYKVSNYMQLYPMNISKFTGNISKNTSKFTSKTDQIRLGGPRGGALPPTRALSWLFPDLGAQRGSGRRGNTLGRGSYDLQL